MSEGILTRKSEKSLPSDIPEQVISALPSGEDTSNKKYRLAIIFMDPEGEAISGLRFIIDTPSEKLEGVTDKDGIGRVEVAGKSIIMLSVVRDDGSKETISSKIMPCSDAIISAIAKSIKIPIKTELHTGGASAPPSAGQGREIEYKRDDKGHPVVFIKRPEKDRKMSEIIKEGVKIDFASGHLNMSGNSYWVFRLMQWCKSGPEKEIELPPPTKDDGKAIEVKMAEGDQKKFETLMNFAMKQAKWRYTGSGSKGAFENCMNQKWKPEDHQKEASKSEGKCLTYVKVALKMAGITSILSTSGNGQAKDAARDYLLPEGFTDVTKQCFSDPYVALPGDVIVYKRIRLSDKDKTRYKKPEDHPGHIEIRTYDGFVSDYFSHHPINSNFNNVTGIYRKVYDEKAQKRQDAFLKMLRILETSNVKDREEDYYLLNSPINGSRHFTDTSQHPWLGKDTNIIPEKYTTAAGAYQIVLKTYNGYMDHLKVRYPISSKVFDAQGQTHFTIRIIAGNPGGDALALIRQGKIKEAIYTAKLNKQWVSLPGGSQCHLKNGYDEFIQMYQSFL